MKLLVSGATGFVGGHLRAALGERHELIPLRQDLRATLDPDALPARVDAVVHLAQSRRYREFPEQAQDIYGVNVHGAFQLLEYARRAGATRFVLASTGSVYAPSDAPLSETSPTAASGFYAATKLAAEALVEAYAGAFATTALRLFFPYGPGQPEAMLIPRLVRRVLDDAPIDLAGEDGLVLQPLHVSDAARAIEGALAFDHGHRVLNVAGPAALSLRAVAEAIGAALNRAPRFAQQPGPAPRLIADTARLEAALGGAQVEFAEGIVAVCRELEGV